MATNGEREGRRDKIRVRDEEVQTTMYKINKAMRIYCTKQGI